ncbi:MAG TPA: hypothetical protein VGI11_19680 [Variovorax sp.]
MNRTLHYAAFVLGLAALCWVGAGFIASNPLALSVTLLIAAFYLMGALELQRFHQATSTLTRALATLSQAPASLGPWLATLHPSLQNPVRLRIEGERVGLPGPALTPYLAGLLVLLGMLGTFLGMVVTLNSTGSALVSATDLPAIRASLAAPVKGLGLAFGTSLAGVAASAMLGLVSALCRRDRLQAAQLLDTRIATTLRAFSQVHQREESFRLLQRQAEAMPALVDGLQAMMASIEAQGRALNERLLANQESFHGQAEAAYAGLALSVGRSLNESLSESARAAGATLQPVVEATMAGIAREAGALHQGIAQGAQRQLDSITTRFEALADGSRHTLASFTETLEQRSSALVEELSLRLAQAQMVLQGELAARDQERQAAAAEVTAELRRKLSDSLVRDNALLEERHRLLETVQTLLGAVNHASTEQRAAIDALVAGSAEVLDRVVTRFGEQAGTESARMAEVAAQLGAGAVEVASLGEAFGFGVQLFSQSNDKLATHLQRVEGALSKSIARSDEQLDYYVAQAREVIDLSILSQKQIVEDLQQLAGSRSAVGSEA